MTEAWFEMITNPLWDEIGGPPPFPREMAEIAIRALLPLSFKSMPELSVTRVEAWLHDRHVPFQFLCPNRTLRGCIVAWRGRAMVFTDPADAPDEQRFTVAHEIAHFLLDYDLPRQNALTAFGETIRPVLDGDRLPTPLERIHAALADVPLGAYHDLMGRDNTGRLVQASIQSKEIRADHLALHLLAPIKAVAAQLPAMPTETERAAFGHYVIPLLQDTFGLPTGIARDYGRRLWTLLQRPSSRQWLGL